MKKILTLLFFTGFLTSAFAQQGSRRQGNQNNDNRYQSPPTARDNSYAYSKPNTGNNGHNENDQWSNRNGQKQYGYDKDRDDRNRNDIQRNQHYQPQYSNQKRMEDDSYRNRRKAPLLRIIFGIGGRH